MSFGSFLREKRETGGPNGARIPRRQLAEDSGLSVGYLARLEQGLSDNPSVAVLERLARALKLEGVDIAHFYRSVTNTEQIVYGSRSMTVTQEQRDYVDGLNPNLAAFVTREWDVLYGNDTYFTVFPGLREAKNIIVWFFLFSSARDVMVEWEHEASLTVSWLRSLMGQEAVTDRVQEVYNLCSGSPDFLRMWNAPERVNDRKTPLMKVQDKGTGARTGLSARLWTAPTGRDGSFLYLAVPSEVLPA